MFDCLILQSWLAGFAAGGAADALEQVAQLCRLSLQCLDRFMHRIQSCENFKPIHALRRLFHDNLKLVPEVHSRLGPIGLPVVRSDGCRGFPELEYYYLSGVLLGKRVQELQQCNGEIARPRLKPLLELNWIHPFHFNSLQIKQSKQSNNQTILLVVSPGI